MISLSNQHQAEGRRRVGVVKLLSSMKLGLFLLILLGAASSLGSLIPYQGLPKLVLSVRDFTIEYYDTQEPKQYVSKLTLRMNGGKEIQQEISVNHPLKAEGLKIYQKSYGWMTQGQVSLGSKSIPFNLANGGELLVDSTHNLKLKPLFIPDFDERIGTLQSKTPFPNNPVLACALLQGNNLLDVQILREGETRHINGYPVTFSGYRYYTGLELKKDPGVVYVYIGFALMLLGFAIRYLAPAKHAEKKEVSPWKPI